MRVLKKIFGLLSLLLLVSFIHAQNYNGFKSQIFTSATSSSAVNLVNSPIIFHVLTWRTIGTVSGCSIKIQQSPNGVDTWTDLIGAQTCTSSGGGVSLTEEVSVNFIRITVTSFTGTGSVTGDWTGYVVDPRLGVTGPTGPAGSPGATGPVGPTGPSSGGIIDAAAFPGADASEKINAAIAAAPNEATITLAGFSSEEVFGTQIVIADKRLTFIGCHSVFSMTMPDPGVGGDGGGININSNYFQFIGDGQGVCVLTQGTDKNIQALVQSGASSNVRFYNLTMNGNEGNQTIPDDVNYYSCWRASYNGTGGGSHLILDTVELTGCGNRATDWRGTHDTWTVNNWCHDSGINIAGGGSSTHGDCLHPSDVDGGTHPYNTYVANNLIQSWGDSAIACINGPGCVVTGNQMYGQAYFTGDFNSFQGGLDVSGASYATITGNIIVDAPTFPSGLTCGYDGVDYTHVDGSTFTGNVFRTTSALVLDTVPQFYIGARFGCQPINLTITGNTFEDVSMKVDGIIGAVISGNSFIFSQNATQTAVFDVSQDVDSTMQGFSITGNSAVSAGALPSVGVNMGASVTTPAPCTIGGNNFTSGITNITWQGGSTNECFVPQAETLYAPFQNAGTTYPDDPVGFYFGPDTLASGRYNNIIGHGTGQSYNFLTRIGGSNTDLLRIFDNVPAQWFIDQGMFKYIDDTSGPVFTFYKANGTKDSPTVIEDFNTAGQIEFKGWDGEAFTRMAWWRCYPIGTIEPSKVPGQCAFNAHDADGITQLAFTFDYGNATFQKPVFINNSNALAFNGSSSGSASIGIPSAAGTPNRINLPTSTGSAGAFLQTDGASPQQTSWAFGSRVLSAQAPSSDTVNCPNNTNTNFATSYTLPANYLTANKVLKVFVGFTMTTSGSPPSMALMLFAGATQIFFASSLSPTTGITGRAGGVEFYIQGTAAAGASVNVITNPVNSWGSTSGALSPTGGNQTAQPVALATNGTLAITPSLFCSANTAANSMTLTQLIVTAEN